MTAHRDTTEADRIVFKIARRGDWDAACRAGRYTGSPDDARDGFIHLSARYQLAGTAAKHFRGIPDLLLIAFEAESLAPALKWEPSRGGDLFPHVYGELDPATAKWTRPLTLDAAGVAILPDEAL